MHSAITKTRLVLIAKDRIETTALRVILFQVKGALPSNLERSTTMATREALEPRTAKSSEPQALHDMSLKIFNIRNKPRI